MFSVYSVHWHGQKSIHVALMAYKRYFFWVTVIESLLNKQLEKS